MPTKSTNIGGQGGARQGSGRKKAAVVDKITDESKRVKILDIPDVEGSEMPKPNEILSAKQKNGEAFQAKSIYENTWEWLQKIGCTVIVSPQLIERYAMCSARWIQCEEMNNTLGLLGKACPHLSARDLTWRYSFCVVGVLSAVADGEVSNRIKSLSGGAADAADRAQLIQQAIDFVTDVFERAPEKERRV